MDQYSDFLLGEVLGERKIVTYRLLSRTLKVHVNLAKEMLHAFHTAQNTKTPDSVHASYLLTGYRVPSKSKLDDDEDTPMDLSPFDPSRTQGDQLVKSIIVVPQDKLEESKSGFSRLSSVHVYSLQPAKLMDLNIISGACQEVLADFADENTTEMRGVYGTISNSTAKKRSPRTVLQTASQTPTSKMPESKKTETKKLIATTPAFAKKSENKPKAKAGSKMKEEGPKVEVNVKVEATAEPTAKKSITVPSTSKTQKDFFSNWNAANKKAKDKKADSKPSSTAQSLPSQTQDTTPEKMETDSEGEDDEPIIPIRDTAEETRKRKAKQQELEDMMDDVDEIPPLIEKEALSPVEPSESPGPPPSAQPPRRRPKRKVTKRVTTRDKEGYLVTKIENVWESCSEDEPTPPLNPKSKPSLTVMKKGRAKGVAGQGSITNFFQKK